MSCQQVLDLLDYGWPQVEAFLANRNECELWNRAFQRSGAAKEGRQRAAAIFSRLAEACVDSVAVHLLVLSQLRGQMSLLPAVIHYIRSHATQPTIDHDGNDALPLIKRILGEVVSTDPLPESDAELSAIAKRAQVGVVHSGEEDELTLTFQGKSAEVSRAELQLAVSLAVINAGLPVQAGTASQHALKFNSTTTNGWRGSVTAERWQGRLARNWTELKRALHNGKVQEAWTDSFIMHRTQSGESRAFKLQRDLTEFGMDAETATLLIASQVAGNVRILEALEAKLPLQSRD